jgi:hypothetical protein
LFRHPADSYVFSIFASSPLLAIAAARSIDSAAAPDRHYSIALLVPQGNREM